MTPELMNEIEAFEKYMGFPARRNRILLEQNEPHDECFSYGLCLRFFGNKAAIARAITRAEKILSMLVSEYNENNFSIDTKHIMDFHAIVGNLYYLAGKYKMAAGNFMKCLNYDKEDITPWMEFLFSIRAMGNIDLFEDAIFNINKLILAWQEDPDRNMNQKKFMELVSKVKNAG